MQGTGTARSLRLRHQLLHGDALDRVTFGALPFVGGVAHGQYVHRHERGGQVERRTHAGNAQIHPLPRPRSVASIIMWSQVMEASMAVETMPSTGRFQARSASAHTMNASGAP